MFSKVDKVDLKILSILKSNGKKSHQDISGKLNFSRPAINKRVSKLEQENVIEGYEAIINYSQIGLPLDSYVLVDICTLDFNKSIERILNLREKGKFILSQFIELQETKEYFLGYIQVPQRSSKIFTIVFLK